VTTRRVLATCGVFEPGFRAGGPVRSVAHILETVGAGTEVTLIAGDRDLGDRRPYPGLSGRWVHRGRTIVFYLNTGNPWHWLRLWHGLRGTRFDLLYLNSLWSPAFTLLPLLAARLGLVEAGRVLLAPRGAFSPAALSRKARKKRLCWRWWGGVLRRAEVLWHASTGQEAADIRAVCPWATVEINANQIALEPAPLPATGHDGPARLVFIGRICAMKNLDLALSAVRTLRERVVFDIYGPLEDPGYWAACQAIIAGMPPTAEVTYRGELAPAQTRQRFAGYDAFVFPTRGENFGHVVAESLSASCPVVCSDRTPWTATLEAGGGVVLRELTVEALGAALARVAGRPAEDRLRARRRAGDAYLAWRAGADDRNILDQVGLGQEGSDQDGLDQDGSDQDGSDQDGSDQDGLDQDGLDQDGFPAPPFAPFPAAS
jgi:glycosyltransferase involved in cell wall biosynthesis